MTEVVNAYYDKYEIYIGSKTASKHFGNPWGTSYNSKVPGVIIVGTEEEALNNYSEWLKGNAHQDVDPYRRKWILNNLDDLIGKTLGCFCESDCCHGNVLLELLGKR